MADATGGVPTAPLLDLDTLIKRPSILIDGTRHELVSPDELSVLVSHRMGVNGRRIEELSKGEEESDGAELDQLITTVAKDILIDVPDDVFARLSGAHKWAVVDVFTGLLLRNKLGVAGAMATVMGLPQIGERLSPASSGSSAVTPAGGSKGLLRRLFGRT